MTKIHQSMEPAKEIFDLVMQIYNCAWISPELKSALENDFPQIKEIKRTSKTTPEAKEDVNKTLFGIMGVLWVLKLSEEIAKLESGKSQGKEDKQ